jgi:cbb3-type cytochrome oxidase subunit 3
MRGGSIPLLAWGALLAVLMAICWIWTGDAIQVGTFGFAVIVVWASAALLAAEGGRQSLRRGAPRAVRGAQAIPTASLGAVLVAVAVGSIVFGFAFGRFLVYFGGGLLVVSIGVVAYELRTERRAARAAAARPRRTIAP